MSDLGRHDPFVDVASWDEATARQWTEALERRAAGADQVALRAELLRLAGLRAGDTAVEIGCGTGPLLLELARAVDPGGRVVGVEPQPGFAEAARRRLADAGHRTAEVHVTSAASLPLPDRVAAACLAQTVLIHLPPATLTAALAEMVRVTRPGGRVVSADQDGDTWTIDHPDRAVTRRIVAFNTDQRYADGWTGRRLPRLFRAAGLADVAVTVRPHVDTEPDSYLYGMALRVVTAAEAAGVVTADEAQRWWRGLEDLAGAGGFFSSINYHVCVGVRPPAQDDAAATAPSDRQAGQSPQ